jgi:hypothetical protein
MSSLYVWTGQEPPANLVITDWIYFLDSAQQQAIVDHLRTVHGMCVVRDDSLIKFWSAGRTIPSGPLVDFIDTNFVASGSYGEYELMVQR